MERILNYGIRSVALRLLAAGIVVILPVGFSTAWLGATYQVVMWDADLARVVMGLTLSGMPAVILVGFGVLYPLERWVIRDRAARSWRWVAARIALYLVASVPIALAFLWGIRLGMRSYPALVESSYFVITVTNIGIVGLLYSLFEQVLKEVQRREIKLRLEIEQLRIEVDEAKRARKVQEITESEYFRQLQARVRRLREGGSD
jgi:hypothetical protein